MDSSAALAIAAVVLLASPAAAQGIHAVDGDTIKLDGTTYRLWGIDSAEARQACADGWPAGTLASKALIELMGGRTITCEERDRDRYGRIVALCRADGLDLGAAMVRAGMAWAFVRYSLDYVEQERAAVGQRVGVHAHDCAKPWDWRARTR
ncbi:MAG: thermonuclease family protein [Enhydrobacter sp.]|nr:thermonuclease family protein [Enhydrobacter sp.]